MISKDKTYRTRDGREVRIYATDGAGRYPVHGAFRDVSYWRPYSWTEDGKADLAVEYDLGCDLVEVKPRHKRTVWLNVDKDGVYCYLSKEAACWRKSSQDDRLACLKVELDFEEGEGLTETVYSIGSGGGSPNWESGGGFTPSVNKVIKDGL